MNTHFEDDPKQPEDNIAFLTRIMTFPKTGALLHGVVFEAIGRYVKQVVDTPIEELRRQFGEGSMVNPDAWYASCKELHDELNARHGKRGE